MTGTGSSQKLLGIIMIAYGLGLDGVYRKWWPFHLYMKNSFIYKDKKYHRMSKCHHPHHLKEEKVKLDYSSYCVVFLFTVLVCSTFHATSSTVFCLTHTLVTLEPVMCPWSAFEHPVRSKNKCRQHAHKSTQHCG